jgi:hypothetical protein
VLLVFAIGWGEGLAAAVAYVAGWWDGAGGDATVTAAGAVRAIVWESVHGIAVIAVAVVVASRYGVGLRQLGVARPRSWRDWHRDAAGVVVGFVLMSLWFVMPHGQPAPRDKGAAALASELVGGAWAGPTEELCLLGFLVVMLRHARQPVWAVLATAVVLRWSFHVYYAGYDAGP